MADIHAIRALDMRFIGRLDGDEGIDVPNGTFLISYSGSFSITASGDFTGTITGFRQSWNGAVVFTAINVNAEARTLMPSAATFDGDAFLKLAFAKDDVMIGSGKADYLVGEGGNDVLHGGNGKDILYGGTGDDRLIGGAGRDVLHGGAGNDRLIGGSGRDTLYGDKGQDVFRFISGTDADGDWIGDFRKGDKIDLSAIDADTTRSGDQAFTFAGTGPGHLTITGIGGGACVRISGDLDGDGMGDFSFSAAGLALTAARHDAFIL